MIVKSHDNNHPVTVEGIIIEPQFTPSPPYSMLGTCAHSGSNRATPQNITLKIGGRGDRALIIKERYFFSSVFIFSVLARGHFWNRFYLL